MNNSDIAATLASTHNITAKDAKNYIDTLVSSITVALVRGEEVSITGLGKFKVKSREARTGRNPATGEAIEIAASTKPTFVPAKALKDSLNS